MKKIINVPYIDQTEEWPTGCESVSAVMLLQYLGVDISVNEFIETYLERKPFVEKDGKIYGPDPRKYFAGSPYDILHCVGNFFICLALFYPLHTTLNKFSKYIS